MTKRNTYSAEYKSRIVIEVLEGEQWRKLSDSTASLKSLILTRAVSLPAKIIRKWDKAEHGRKSTLGRQRYDWEMVSKSEMWTDLHQWISNSAQTASGYWELHPQLQYRTPSCITGLSLSSWPVPCCLNHRQNIQFWKFIFGQLYKLCPVTINFSFRVLTKGTL